MSGQDLRNSLNEIQTCLKDSLSKSRSRGLELAECERAYRLGRAKEVRKEKALGTASTIMKDLVDGNTEVAELRFKRDTALVLYKSAQDAINVYKLNLRVIQEDMQREYGNGKNN